MENAGFKSQVIKCTPCHSLIATGILLLQPFAQSGMNRNLNVNKVLKEIWTGATSLCWCYFFIKTVGIYHVINIHLETIKWLWGLQCVITQWFLTFFSPRNINLTSNIYNIYIFGVYLSIYLYRYDKFLIRIVKNSVFVWLISDLKVKAVLPFCWESLEPSLRSQDPTLKNSCYNDVFTKTTFIDMHGAFCWNPSTVLKCFRCNTHKKYSVQVTLIT